MSRYISFVLFLLTSTTFPQSVHGHAFWAQADKEADRVAVAFSEHAGVADKVIARFETRLTNMVYTGVDATYDVSLSLNDEKNLMGGDLTPPAKHGRNSNDVENNDGPYFVSGFLDNGPYERFHDVRFSFAAQMYKEDADFDNFFRPLLKEVGETPTIVMRNCGGSKGTSYQFDFAGFPSEGPVGVCIYQKGGIQIGCGNFDAGVQEKGVHGATSRERQFRNSAGTANHRQLSVPMFQLQDSPTLLYAKANQTVTDEATGDINIFFASTSVYFHGPCEE